MSHLLRRDRRRVGVAHIFAQVLGRTGGVGVGASVNPKTYTDPMANETQPDLSTENYFDHGDMGLTLNRTSD